MNKKNTQSNQKIGTQSTGFFSGWNERFLFSDSFNTLKNAERNSK